VRLWPQAPVSESIDTAVHAAPVTTQAAAARVEGRPGRVVGLCGHHIMPDCLRDSWCGTACSTTAEPSNTGS
jgi:hypothetical protein